MNGHSVSEIDAFEYLRQNVWKEKVSEFVDYTLRTRSMQATTELPTTSDIARYIDT